MNVLCDLINVQIFDRLKKKLSLINIKFRFIIRIKK